MYNYSNSKVKIMEAH